MILEKYKSLIFDCDGVVLDSNKVKTNAFYKAGMHYGEVAAEKLKQYHMQNGGISRYKKFEYFFNEIIDENSNGPDIEALLVIYGEEVRKGLLECNVVEGLSELREQNSLTRWFIVSGGDQNELREIFALRGLDSLFDGGIFGSPDDKKEILKREINSENIQLPALFIGDSRYDHVAAKFVNIDFVFVANWTEFKDYPIYCENNNILVIQSFEDLVSN